MSAHAYGRHGTNAGLPPMPAVEFLHEEYRSLVECKTALETAHDEGELMGNEDYRVIVDRLDELDGEIDVTVKRRLARGG